MGYTVGMKWKFVRVIECFLVATLAACGSLITPQATPKPASAQDSRPVATSRVLQKALPQVCDCTLRFDHLTIEQGLSQSSINAIFQDSRGFMWFGTQDGLNRYDGYSFKVYKPDPDNDASLSDGWITSIVEDKDGFLWIGTNQGGLNRFDPKLETFTHYAHDPDNLFSLNDNHVNQLFVDHEGNLWVGTMHGMDRFDKTKNNFAHYLTNLSKFQKNDEYSITAIHQDQHGQFWVGTAGSGFLKFYPATNSFDAYQSNPDNPSTISSDYITSIAEDEHSIIWVGTRRGLNRFDPNTGWFARFTRTELNLGDNVTGDQTNDISVRTQGVDRNLSSNAVNTLVVDSTGNLWIGTSKGLNRYEPGQGFVQYLNDPSYSRSLSNNSVMSLYEDNSGAIWIGTWAGGVNLYDRQRDLFSYYRHDPQDPNSLPDNSIGPIFVDSTGYAWIGTAASGLNRHPWNTNQFFNFQYDARNPSGLSSNDVTSIAQDQDSFLWIGSQNGLDKFNPRTMVVAAHYRNDPANPDSLSNNRVYTVFVDRANNVWAGTYTGLDQLDRTTGKFTHYVHKADDPASLSGNLVYAMAEDQDGKLWVGTFESGLNLFDPRTGTFKQYRRDPKDKTTLNNDSILAIYRDTKGRIWIGTGGGGLNLYHPASDSFSYYLEKDGLPNGVVYGILEDDFGNLWMSTNYGISRFNPETKVFRNFDAGDGLQSNEFNSSAYAKGKHGEMYFGGVNGLTVFHPANIADNPFWPQVALTSLTQDDKPLAVGTSVETVQSIELHYPQNSFDFNFAALSYNQPHKNQYAYFLEGFDTNWHYIGTKRDGRYTNLPGGQYTLLLKAANSDGVWNETPTRIAVTVVPPFWQTNIFRVLLAMFAVATVVGGVGLRTKSIQDRNRALEHTVQQRTHELEDRNREMEALYKADERILRNVSLNQVFQTLVDVAVDMLNADRSVVFAWDKKQTKVVPRVSHGYAPATLKVMEFAKGEGNVGQVLATGKPVIAREIDPESMRPDVRAAIFAEGIRSFMHLPIVVDHNVIAVFNVAFTGPDFISEDIVRLFTALVNRAAISIANMELFEQTKDLAVMEERNRLARDLHDSAKQKAFAALAQLGAARGLLNGNGHLVSPQLNEAENLVSDVIQELTFLVQEIYPIALQEKGLTTTLREYIFEWESRNDARVNFTVRQDRRLPLDIEQAIYRVTQEALANVARHSQARRVDLSLVYNEDSLQLCLSDDGQGFDMTSRPAGMGLRSIRERVGSIRGTAQIQSAPGQGTRILVQVPTKG